MLNELDQELTRRSEYFVRYADDLIIFCPSKAAANQALKHIAPCIEEKLFLSLNKEKTVIVHADKAKFLGYGFFRSYDGYRLRVHERSLEKMRLKLSNLAMRAVDAEGFKNLKQYITSWTAQYKSAALERFLTDCSGWMGKELQAIFIEAWNNFNNNY